MNVDTCHIGDCRTLLRDMAAAGVRARTCVTSPPYFGLRDYSAEGQIGLEASPDDYVESLVDVFRGVRDVLTDDGTVWLNLGDSYVSVGSGMQGKDGQMASRTVSQVRDNKAVHSSVRRPPSVIGLAPKNLIGIPWRVAFALQADGWYLRSDIIWHKPNPMPESVRDRPTKAHEYLFLLSKSQNYYYDADAILEPAEYRVPNSPASIKSPHGQGYTRRAGKAETSPRNDGNPWNECNGRGFIPTRDGRNRRSVWQVATTPYSETHFAVFPRALVEPCILAGSAQGDVVLDPFMGSGTTAQVAEALGRRWIGCELQPSYLPLIESRLQQRTLAL